MNEPKKNEWLGPSAIIGIVGLIVGTGGSYMAFDGRLSKVEEAKAHSEERLNRIEDKIDWLIQRGVK